MSKSQLPVRSIILAVSSYLKIMVTEFLYNFNIRTYAHHFFNTSMSTLLHVATFILPKSSRSEDNFAKKYGSWAVVTGATDDIGSAYVRELAARKMNIVLLSCTEENLKEVAAKIENEFTVQTKTIVANFTEGRHVYERAEKELRNLQIGILVNNVSMNVPPPPLLVTEMTEDLMWNIVHANCIPVLIMIRMILPRMLRNRKGAIVNVSPMVDLQPAPFIAVYSAAKAFITVFTKALQLENRGSGVTIQILSPEITNSARNMRKSDCCPDILPEKATDFVKHAISTLGISGNDAGSHLHSILTTFIGMIPFSLKTFSVVPISEIFRIPYNKEKLNRN